MSAQEQAYLCVTLVVWGLMLWGAIRIFGLRRVVWGLVLFAFLAVAVAFKTLGAITDRRY
jgi:hypothetical protein